MSVTTTQALVSVLALTLCVAVANASIPSRYANKLLAVVYDPEHLMNGAVVLVDPLTGKSEQLAMYAESVDILESALDLKSGIYHMISSDGDAVFSEMFNLTTGYLAGRLPISGSPMNVVFDDKLEKMYGLDSTPDSIFMAQVDLSGMETHVASLKSVIGLYGDVQAYDPVHHTYYFIGDDLNNAPCLLGVNVAAGKVVSNVSIADTPSMIYDVAHSRLVGLNGSMAGVLNPKTASFTPLPESEVVEGIIALHSIDASNGIAYVVLQDYEKQKIISIDLESGKILSSIFIDLQLAYVHFIPSSATEPL
eukprot:ANDGO_03588.mRNA.1 hypothetical protein